MGKRVPKKEKKAFAGVLKAWREERKLTQAEAARVLEIPLKTLQNWEIARTKPQGFAHTAILRFLERGR